MTSEISSVEFSADRAPKQPPRPFLATEKAKTRQGSWLFQFIDFCDMIHRVSEPALHIRPGTLYDLSQVQEFSSKTFSWGDYVPSAWQGWVRSKRGDLLVAELDSTIVGTIHVRYLEHREAWLEGVRVRREYRQRGIAGQLVQAAHECARQKKCRVIRLETNAKNINARKTFEKFGYQQLVEYRGFKASVRDGDLDEIKLARVRDVNACWELWQGSWVQRASKCVVPAVYGWRWWELTRNRLLQDVREKRVWLAGRAFMVTRFMDEDLDITLLVGEKRDAKKLLHAARVLAKQRGRANAYWNVPHVPRASAWADAAGYKFDEDGILIYARAF